jgi:transcriptional regulator with XRE-family HTH domain
MTGLELLLLRRAARVRQYVLAARLGVPPSTLSEYENGHREIPPALAAQVVELLSPRSTRKAPSRQSACEALPQGR